MTFKAAWGWVVGAGFMSLLSAGVLMPSFDDVCFSSRESRRQSDLKNVQAALEHHHRAHGSYPSTDGEWRGDMGVLGGYGYDEAGYIPGLVPGSLPSLPNDPAPEYPDQRRGYMYRSDGTDYKIVLLGTPENFDEGNPYLDPVRTDAWQMSTPGASHW